MEGGRQILMGVWGETVTRKDTKLKGEGSSSNKSYFLISKINFQQLA